MTTTKLNAPVGDLSRAATATSGYLSESPTQEVHLNHSVDPERNDDFQENETKITSVIFSPQSQTGDDADDDLSSRSSGRYKWRKYAPSFSNPIKFVRWLVVGGARFAPQATETERMAGLGGLAQCIMLLRTYMNTYGMAEEKEDDESQVLRELVRNLYKGGVPLWALEPCMQKVAEGLTGETNVEWFFLPRKTGVFCSGRTRLFGITRGYDVSLLDATEKIATRCASYASNANSMSATPATFPNPKELNDLVPRGSFNSSFRMDSWGQVDERKKSADELGREILDLASRSNGLMYFINSRGYLQSTSDKDVDDFWVVSGEERELFRRLACSDAKKMIQDMNKTRKELYPSWLLLLCRMMSGAGASAIWFNGSWIDIVFAGLLAGVIAKIAQSTILSKQEKIIFEVVASVVVGLGSGIIAALWPEQACFEAMALAAVVDILQGFRIVFAVIEVMSKHTVAGSADLIEGVVFTGLIAMSLRFGLEAALKINIRDDITDNISGSCGQGIDQRWFFLFVPLASIAWATLFNPNYRDLLPMAFHGTLGFTINFLLAETNTSGNMNLFIAASVLSFSAGVISRFTGRQSVGNTVCGIYVLVPGAYLTKRFFDGGDPSAFMEVAVRGIIIGLGTWTGSIFCSPTILGSTRTLLFQSQQRFYKSNHGSVSHRAEKDEQPTNEPFTLLLF
ncbi:putative threonine/serine exporter [Nitzschia inconspicua]|uniref:Threonine/serine exporter n=1 Tax=Nitzschia inconspicua TaxID=303405 RepID=A0A9K3LUA4_9STRA|nr:putative threonine/serine exporter [Nitzschia inconspicua]